MLVHISHTHTCIYVYVYLAMLLQQGQQHVRVSQPKEPHLTLNMLPPPTTRINSSTIKPPTLDPQFTSITNSNRYRKSYHNAKHTSNTTFNCHPITCQLVIKAHYQQENLKLDQTANNSTNPINPINQLTQTRPN